MSMFYIAVSLESFIHCFCGPKKVTKASVDSPIFKYNVFHILHTLI